MGGVGEEDEGGTICPGDILLEVEVVKTNGILHRHREEEEVWETISIRLRQRSSHLMK